MNYIHTFICSVFFVVGLVDAVSAQSSQIEKANELYQAGQYSRAIDFYEEALSIRDNTALQSKLAYCYRMINRQDKALPLYDLIIRSGKARKDDFYYYGESLMGAGRYEEAKSQFQKYLELDPDDERALLMIANCEKAPLIRDMFASVNTQPFSRNSEVDDNAPVFCEGGILFASDRKLGFRLLKEKSDWTGRDYINLYYAPRTGDNTFAEADLYSAKINELNKNTGNASFTADGSQVFFSRNNDELSKSNSYNLQLYVAESAGNGKWKSPKRLPVCSPEWNYMHPAISPDGKTLYFVSDKRDGQGGTDIYVSTLNKKGWSNAVNLGPVINTPANEGFPFFSSDNKLFFCSKGHSGLGGFDIFCATLLPNGEWGTPVNIGRPFNSTYDDISVFFAPDNRSGLFTSSRDGGDDDIWLFKIGEPSDQSEPVSVISAETEKPAMPLATTTPAPAPIPDAGLVPVKPAITESPAAFSKEMASANTTLSTAKPEKSAVDNTTIRDFLLDTINDAMMPPDGRGNTLKDLEWFLKYRQPLAGKSFIVENIQYPKDQIAVTPGIALVLDNVADLLLRYPALMVEMGVHTESTGDDALNLQKSQYRSEIIVEYLVFKGIDPKRLFYKGYGESRPLNGCVNGVLCSPEDLMVNHRVEMKIMEARP